MVRVWQRLGTGLAFARAAFQQRLAYRVANWAGVFTNAFFLFLRVEVLQACYLARDDIGGLSVLDATTYVAVTQAILMVAPQWGILGVANQVRSGEIATSLLRPVDFVGMTLAGRLGVSAYYAVMRMPPLLFLATVAGVLVWPSPVALLAFLVSLVLAAVVGNAVLLLVELSAFWLESEVGVRQIVMGLGQLPSGLVLPVAFFPGAVQTVFRATPFAVTLDLPARIWLEEVTGPALVSGLGLQLFWAVLLVGSARAMVNAGTRRLQVVGG